jgi:HK97 gp10 family phage protein
MIPKMGISDDLSKRLEALPTALSKPILLRSLTVAAEPIRSRGEALAPRSSPDAGKPGHMADHIVVSPTNRVEGRTLESTEAAVAVGPSKDFWWAKIHEFGPADGRYSAHPFMRPAYDSGSPIAFSILQEQLWIELRKAAESGVGAGFTASQPIGGETL